MKNYLATPLALLVGCTALLARAEPVPGYFDSAALVAQVRIAEIHRERNEGLSQPGITAVQGYIYAAETRKVWKGSAGETVAFRITLSDCHRKLEAGGEYLIFATHDGLGRLEVKSCEAVVPEAQWTPVLASFTPRD